MKFIYFIFNILTLFITSSFEAGNIKQVGLNPII